MCKILMLLSNNHSIMVSNVPHPLQKENRQLLREHLLRTNSPPPTHKKKQPKKTRSATQVYNIKRCRAPQIFNKGHVTINFSIGHMNVVYNLTSIYYCPWELSNAVLSILLILIQGRFWWYLVQIP